MSAFIIEEWFPPAVPDADLEALADVIHAVVHAGAGISFIVPFSLDDAKAFWFHQVLPAVRARNRRVVIARTVGDADSGKDGRIVGTVQIILDTPPNQLHRADIAKMMVHPDARRLGIARALMLAIEDIARAERRTLLTLDTVTGGPAESLYRSLGYIEVGVIPRYARSSLTPELEGTTIMYKELNPP